MSNSNFKTEGATGSKSKEGVIQWVVPYYVPNIDQVLTVGKVPFHGCEEVSRTWSCNNDGANPSYIVTVVYEGGSEGNGDEPSEQETIWSIDFEMSEEPIASHHNWDEIKEAYGAVNLSGNDLYSDDWKFPKTMPNGKSSGSGLNSSSSGAGGGAKNKMYGVTTYIVMTAIASKSYTRKNLPPSVIGDIGQSMNQIPGAPNDFSGLDKGERTWMKMPPQVSKRGNVWQITESWRLSEHYEWPKEVYPDGAGRF